MKDFILPNGMWNVDKWRKFLPPWITNTLAKLRTPSGNEKDRFIWRTASNGNFSIRAAYKFVSTQVEHSVAVPWRKVWKLPVPEKVKFFFWQVFHDRLPTNALRAKRGLTNNAECPFECLREENTLHILRDCEIARNVWIEIIKPNHLVSFFCSDLQVWLRRCMSHNLGNARFGRWIWTRVFCMICWLIWKNRCRGVMENMRHQAKEIIHNGLANLMESTIYGQLKHQVFKLDELDVYQWQPPPEGYVRLDTDGSANNNREAACGGLIRDATGQWIFGFQRQLGFMKPTAAEILALLNGLQICRQQKLNKIIAYIDSMEAFNLIYKDGWHGYPLRSEINEIRNLLFSNWEIELRYEPREALRCVDFLAKDAQHLRSSSQLLPNAHPGCLSFMRDDNSQHLTLGVLF